MADDIKEPQQAQPRKKREPIAVMTIMDDGTFTVMPGLQATQLYGLLQRVEAQFYQGSIQRMAQLEQVVAGLSEDYVFPEPVMQTIEVALGRRQPAAAALADVE